MRKPAWWTAERTSEGDSLPPACYSRLTLLGKSGAGEGIRTLDPNLGKVVLYP